MAFLLYKSVIGVVILFFYSAIFPFNAAYPITKDQSVKKAIEHFLSIQTMQGTFLQEDAGYVMKGEFFMARPSKFYFKYSSPSSVSLISDGSNIAVYNAKLDTWSVYPLRYMAFSVIFSNNQHVIQESIQRVESNNSFITIFFKDDFMGNMISVTFDRLSYRLLNWKIMDSSRRYSIIKILKYKENTVLDPKVFEIPYDKIHNIN
ncbi:outer-membrane lipoprotein carrier protein LolA [Candidatus Liberibacter asiaticus]|uniref:Possible lolA type protein n=2 Tax=Liberibacter asiaticus TaxID=34021 RepID=C6XFW8_LIBAP|nr:outer-membrane lipoprotein carrier protein LolA [Candidatus Liberibacter asiaticus]ACT57271.1 possible lolA type protein [Candidatus Liberibacter asiaticus str. psy62]AGH16764.1 putative lolA type protein [Candidatus Liberibacter asiaticus str. gxpsy]ALK07133.1 outer membrane lipoprotein carrier protein LolA [Candidatus Liberibacter asiaticus]ASK52609.1 lolA type protein [Candidatus Liberibacter asiaticus]AWL13934.1 outer membrane lipoprotein carrier protein LolA [Candidatus Liberibacter as